MKNPLSLRGKLPFRFSAEYIRFDKEIIIQELRLGMPVALQDTLTGLAFLFIQTVINSFGLDASAGAGIAEKVNFLSMDCAIRIDAVHVCICSTKPWRGKSGQGGKSAWIRDRSICCHRRPVCVSVVLPWKPSGYGL